jgi:hypothetical protein
VTLRAPDGRSVTVAPDSPFDEFTDAEGNVLAQARLVAAWPSGRRQVVLSVARTAVDPAATWGHAIAPFGLWRVDIVNGSGGVLELDAWIRRSDTPSWHRAKGRQSYFEDSEERARHHQNGRPVEFDGSTENVWRRRGTLSGIATSKSAVVIGGYRRGDRESDLHPAPYSSAGPDGNMKRAWKAPDWLEVSEDSIACRGVIAAGTRSGSWVAMNGTSAAAPQAARWIAQEWRLSGSPPGRPTDLVQPKPNPHNPIPGSDRADIVGGGLHPSSLRQRRTSPLSGSSS